MIGLSLEGGGAKGAFHVGALNALADRGITFDGVMGTSIGAINGAMVAQNDLKVLTQVWSEMTPQQLFGVDEAHMEKYLSGTLDLETCLYFVKKFVSVVGNRGIPIEKTESILNDLVDEDKLRQSAMDYGLVTVDMTSKWIPMEVFKEDIAEGMLKKYILASAYFPAFKRNPIEGKVFMDGGIYDNLPINPLVRKGYNEIIAIRTMSRMPHQKVVDSSVSVGYIVPSEPLGNTLAFTNSVLKDKMQLGYYDAIRYLDGLAGKMYYIKPITDMEFSAYLEQFGAEVYKKWADAVEVEETSKLGVIKALFKYLNKDETESFSDFESFVLCLEPFAEFLGIDRFTVYSINEFVEKMQGKHLSQVLYPEKLQQNKFFKAVMALLENKI